ncbi:(2Fe-2S)-binding protein [Stratiformator vulcanicus]|uniref:BFD-like [2Fe-2S] binding domain protein n=1 Tax=Stratiformator vulcanicus TaxID=2527980 RepID=A0A517R314_9PLAN|nr:(2Fe-2S)-binding protein [Stratiformator vulcanicus]QDT38272.1 BFD-like [2Fe-2S] binding domain protein [Stratiformator vulcanicus]
MELDDKVCLCFHVSKRKIVNFIRVHEPRVPSQISECGGAGTGCGWCVPFLKRYFREYARGETAAEQEPDPAAYRAARTNYVRAGKGTPPAGAEPVGDE